MLLAASSDKVLRIAGIDEVGRGCLAGPVIAAAVILDAARPIAKLADSKKLTPSRRQQLATQIQSQALCWAIGRAEASEIDRINILQASLLAMQRAVSQLQYTPDFARVDGNQVPALYCKAEAIVQGDATVAEISAASILAKVARDMEMQTLDRLYPGYGFAIHKAYPTREHLDALQCKGITLQHRKSFAPVKNIINHPL